jgi:hypothetical protein
LKTLDQAFSIRYLDYGHVSGGRAFGTLFDFKGNPVTFVERPETVGVDGRMMNENVRTVFLLDKTIPLAVVEPLHDTICHADFLLQINKKIIASNFRRHFDKWIDPSERNRPVHIGRPQ